MQPEPAELQILRQLLGHERGSDVFALYTMAASCAQLSQQVQQQAEQIQHLQQPSPPLASPAEGQNPWTGGEPCQPVTEEP